MPRKLLFRTKDFPYHLTARSNNKEWFYLEKDNIWRLSNELLHTVGNRYGFQVHTYVLMSNHFHLIGSTPEADIGTIMNYFLREMSKRINANSGRINRIFGARYHWSVIDDPVYYSHAYKYVIRNPVEAGMVERVEEYPFSTLRKENDPMASGQMPILSPHRFQSALGNSMEARLQWLNDAYDVKKKELVRRALRRTTFRFTKDRSDRHHVAGLSKLPFEK